MSWQKYVLVALFIISSMITWYMVDRPRTTTTFAVAFLATLVNVGCIALVLTA